MEEYEDWFWNDDLPSFEEEDDFFFEEEDYYPEDGDE
jgi:hypothetical protein